MTNNLKNKLDATMERINGLRNNKEEPKEDFLKTAKQMKDYYNGLKQGRRGMFDYMNDNATLVLARQLEAISTQIMMEPQAPVIGRELFGNVVDVSPFHTSYTYPIMKEEGIAKVVGASGDDLPMVGAKLEEQTHKILPVGAYFEYTVQEVEAAAFGRYSLSMEGPRLCRKAFDRKLDDIIAFGDSDFGITYGLANQPAGTGVNQVRSTACTTGSNWTGAVTTTKADACLADLSRLVAEYDRDNLGVAPADFLLLPPGAMSFAKQARLSDSGMTVMERFIASNPGIRVRAWEKLGDVDDSSSGGEDARAILGSSSPQTAEIILAKDFTLEAPQPHNLKFKVPGAGYVGGLALKQRINMRYLTGLPTE